MCELKTRLFQEADAELLTELLHQAYAELGARGLNYTAVDQDVATTRMRAQGGRCLIVEKDGIILGTLTMSLPPSDALQALTAEARALHRAWLNQVAVSPSSRKLGIASQLWGLSRQWAISEGATSVGVDTATPAEHLIQLYTAWGFQAVETIHWPGKTYDSTIMTRTLEAACSS